MAGVISQCNDLDELDKDVDEISYFIREFKFDDYEFKISQKFIGDVGCVVWDSAIVACHYFVRNQSFWKNKKVLELGAGAGLCSIVLAALGANVVATDLAEGMKLLKRNIRENLEVVARNEGSVKAKILDWNSPSIESISFDVIVMIDVIYYLKALEGLVRLVLQSDVAMIICCYEIRDLGEPKIAQKQFFEIISPFFNICKVAENDLDDVYKSPDIKVLRLVRK